MFANSDDSTLNVKLYCVYVCKRWPILWTAVCIYTFKRGRTRKKHMPEFFELNHTRNHCLKWPQTIIGPKSQTLRSCSVHVFIRFCRVPFTSFDIAEFLLFADESQKKWQSCLFCHTVIAYVRNSIDGQSIIYYWSTNKCPPKVSFLLDAASSSLYQLRMPAHPSYPQGSYGHAVSRPVADYIATLDHLRFKFVESRSAPSYP